MSFLIASAHPKDDDSHDRFFFLEDVLLSWLNRVPIFFWSLLLYPIPEEVYKDLHSITSCY